MRLYHVNGEVYLECLSDSSVFVQSRLSNMSRGFNGNTVIKLQNTPGASASGPAGGPPGGLPGLGLGLGLGPGAGPANAAQETQARSLCVFDSAYFSRLLQEALRRAPTPSYDEVYELAKLCSVRLSFVKGWGAEYHRQVRSRGHFL